MWPLHALRVRVGIAVCLPGSHGLQAEVNPSARVSASEAVLCLPVQKLGQAPAASGETAEKGLTNDSRASILMDVMGDVLAFGRRSKEGSMRDAWELPDVVDMLTRDGFGPEIQARALDVILASRKGCLLWTSRVGEAARLRTTDESRIDAVGAYTEGRRIEAL